MRAQVKNNIGSVFELEIRRDLKTRDLVFYHQQVELLRITPEERPTMKIREELELRGVSFVGDVAVAVLESRLAAFDGPVDTGDRLSE